MRTECTSGSTCASTITSRYGGVKSGVADLGYSRSSSDPVSSTSSPFGKVCRYPERFPSPLLGGTTQTDSIMHDRDFTEV